MMRSRRTRPSWCRAWCPGFDQLEERTCLSGPAPTEFEQIFLDRLNAARSQLSATRPGSVQANQPLVFSPEAKGVIGTIKLSKINAIKNALKRSGAPFDSKYSIATFSGSYQGDSEGLFEDFIPYAASTIASFARRNKNYAIHQLVGLDIETGAGGAISVKLLTFAIKGKPSIVTGSVFDDRNGNGQIDAGEGVAGATVAVSGGRSAQTNAFGGYSLTLQGGGTFELTASGPGLLGPIVERVSVPPKTTARVNFAAKAPQPQTLVGTFQVGDINGFVNSAGYFFQASGPPETDGSRGEIAARKVSLLATIEFKADNTFIFRSADPDGAGGVLYEDYFQITGRYQRTGNLVTFGGTHPTQLNQSSVTASIDGTLTLGGAQPILALHEEFDSFITPVNAVSVREQFSVTLSKPVVQLR